MGPYVVQTVVERVSAKWKETLSAELQATLKFVDADAPFSTDTDIEPKGYWVLPAHRDKEKRVKEFRRHSFIGLVAMLTEVDRHRPRLVVGVGQGAIIVGLAALPMVAEAACPARAVTPLTMRSYRQAWSGVAGLKAINPEVMPQHSEMDLVERAIP